MENCLGGVHRDRDRVRGDVGGMMMMMMMSELPERHEAERKVAVCNRCRLHF